MAKAGTPAQTSLPAEEELLVFFEELELEDEEEELTFFEELELEDEEEELTFFEELLLEDDEEELTFFEELLLEDEEEELTFFEELLLELDDAAIEEEPAPSSQSTQHHSTTPEPRPPNFCMVYFSMSIRKFRPFLVALRVQQLSQPLSPHSSSTWTSMVAPSWRRRRVFCLYMSQSFSWTATMLCAATHSSVCWPLTPANWPAHLQPLYLMHSSLPGSG